MDVDGSGNVVHHIELTKIQFFVREDATWVELIKCAGKSAAFTKYSGWRVLFSFDSQLATSVW